MKKILPFFLALAFGMNLSFAQEAKKANVKKAEDKQAAPVKTDAKSDKPAAGPTKKDGTPDMRYKANKDAKAAEAKPAGPTKKDGTPDMRYKENKDAAKDKKEAPKK